MQVLTRKSKKQRNAERTCQRKTKRGNAYATEGEARVAAREIEEQSLYKINAFNCTVCGLWHIGGGGLKEEYQDIPVDPVLLHPPTHIGVSLADALHKAGI